jgi:hypothetical protein
MFNQVIMIKNMQVNPVIIHNREKALDKNFDIEIFNIYKIYLSQLCISV